MIEEKKKIITSQLLRYVLPNDYSEEEREANPIAAEEVVAAIQAGKIVEIINAVIDGPLVLNSAIIEGKVTIKQTNIRGLVDCSYATFKGVLNLENSTFENDSIFTATSVEKDIFLNNAVFRGKATFANLNVTGVFYSRNIQFIDDAIFEGSDFNKGIIISRSLFSNNADFATARISGGGEFSETTFRQRANFGDTEIAGHALFRQVAFDKEAAFIRARISGGAEFSETTFKTRANFNNAQVEYRTSFKRATFEEDVSFGSASFKSILFAQPETRFNGKVDLRGCIYDRIEPISIWKELMERLDPYDRQPFTQLNETLRRAGEDYLTKEVYYKRKREESVRITMKKPVAWLIDRYFWLLFGYGVRFSRMFVAIALILGIGTFIFTQKGAVTFKHDNQRPSVISSQANKDATHFFTNQDAFLLTLRLFLPIEIPIIGEWIPVDIIGGSAWEPSSTTIGIRGIFGIKFESLTMLKLAGWILIVTAVIAYRTPKR